MSCSDHPSPSTRSLSEASSSDHIRLTLDLVAAARQNIGFLKDVAESHWLHHTPVLIEAVRRYDELWMPIMSDATAYSGKPPMILPPLDVEWVWFCHTLNPVAYRQYCDSRFSKLIGKPAIFNQENKDYALDRCKERWVTKYPYESFEQEANSGDVPNENGLRIDDLLGEISKQRCLLTKFSKPYMLELVYLIAAKNRYKGFLYVLQRFVESSTGFVPTSDILLMWITHKSYPTAYAIDVKEMDEGVEKIIESGESVNDENLEAMKKLWERVFDQPYEKAGCPVIDDVKPSIHWEVTDSDVNVKYRPLLPRFLLEVNILVKQIPKMMEVDTSKEFLRFQFLRCHRDFKINNPISTIPTDSWRKAVDLYCEFGTKGMVVELRRKGGVCFKGSKLLESKTFMWNELLRAPSITLNGVIGQRSRVFVSITPPAQAPYLFKSVPDRVTDDSGAMVSEVILKMNQYRPQEGRWLSRTVLDHAGRECFVIRMRVAGGVWRRGSNKPSVVKREDRCIEIREGSWSYVAGSIGKAPEKVIATATPNTPPQQWRSSWSFSTGHDLFIAADLSFNLKTSTSTDSQIRLLKGRHFHYQNEENEGDEDGFVTIVRFSEENPEGRATGLINWKHSAVEFLPEEDAAFVLLLSTAILRSVTEMRKEDVGGLLVRRRLKEAKHGERDWGSVLVMGMEGWLKSPSVYVKPWYWNAEAVMAREGADYVNVSKSYSVEECGDDLYKQALFG